MWAHQAFNIGFGDEDEVATIITKEESKPAYDYVLSATPRHLYPSPQRDMIIDEEEDDDVLFGEMIEKNKISLLYEAFDKEIDIAGDEGVEIVAASTQATSEQKTIHRLFETYLSESFLGRLRLSFDEVYETVSARAKPHKNEVLRDRAQIEAIIDMFIKRMVLGMLNVDKAATKSKEMYEKIEALYYKRYDEKTKKLGLVAKVKNDFIHHDYVDRIRLEREKLALDRATDPVSMHFSEPKKRGRHAKNRVEEVWNEMETLASQYILSKKLNSPITAATTTLEVSPPQIQQKSTNAVNFYPTFEKTLTILNQSIPRLTNHGWYIEMLLRAIRTLDPKVWPLHGLATMLHNANYVVHAKRVITKFDRVKCRFYCCFSGLEIKNGETVTWIKVVENDAERLAAWHENTVLLNRPFEAPEFKRSVASFYMKSELCCPVSLFYAPFSDAYKERFASHFSPKTTVTLDLKRKQVIASGGDGGVEEEEQKVIKKKKKTTRQETCVSTHPITQIMLHLVSLFTAGDASERLIHNELVKYRKNYDDEKTELFGVFEAISDRSFTNDLQRVIYYCFIGSPYYDIETMERDAQLSLIADCLDTVLDIFEIVTVATPNFAKKSVLAERLAFSVVQRKKQRTTYENLIAQCIREKTTESSAIAKFAALPFLGHFSFFFLILFEYLFAREIKKVIKPTGERATLYTTLLHRLHLTCK
jgi:hypothetical protein